MNLQKLSRFILQNSKACFPYRIQEKQLFDGWVNARFNKFDPDRVKEIGPDRAAAEWILRCGGAVKWKNFAEFTKDYNRLPAGAGNFHIEAIDASESSIMSLGFEHLKGLNHCTEIKFSYCQHLDDEGLEKLAYIKDTLRRLEIIYCMNLGEKGLKSLSNLTNLQFLRLFGLNEKTMKGNVVDFLKQSLPQCKIDLTEGPKTEKLK